MVADVEAFELQRRKGTGGLSAVLEALSFEVALRLEEGWMRKWYWWRAQCVSDVGQRSFVCRRGIYLGAACLVSQCTSLMGYLVG